MKNFTVLLLLISTACFSQIPNWTWAKNSGIYFNTPKYSAADNQGNVYLVGTFREPTITISGTTLTNTSNATFADMYVIKYSPTGALLYSKVIGGPKNDAPASITTDPNGNLYICGGITDSVTIGTTTLVETGGPGYIAKFNPDGDLVWAHHYSDPGSPASVTEIKADSAGNIYIAGNFYGHLPTVFGDVLLTYENYNASESSSRSYVAKLDNQGNGVWAKAGSSNETGVFGNFAYAVAVDDEGSVYTGGLFFSLSLAFDDITLTKSLQATGNGNMYIVKYDSNGNALWAHNAGSQYLNQTATLAISTTGNNAYVSGYFTNTATFGSTILQAFSGSNLFTVKYDTAGNVLWAKKPSNTGGFSSVQSSDTDSAGNLYIAGTFSDDSMNFGNGVMLTNPTTGDGGAYVVKYDPSGNALWGKKAGQLNINNVISIDCVSQNELYFSGTFYAPTMSFGTITLNKTPSTNYDAFIAKLYYAPLASEDFNLSAISIYPNPVHGALYIENLPETAEYTVTDITGKIILNGTFTNMDSMIDTTSLIPGLYLVSLTSLNGKVITKKVVVY